MGLGLTGKPRRAWVGGWVGACYGAWVHGGDGGGGVTFGDYIAPIIIIEKSSLSVIYHFESDDRLKH